MTMNRCKYLASLAMLMLSHAACAAPGTPIGGIIVKGGKNPGGQMLVLGTTDSNGKFNVKFSESGEYRLQFMEPVRKAPAGRVAADFHVEYVIDRRERTDSAARESVSARPVPVSSTLKDAQLMVTVPPGGAEISGTLQGPAAAAGTSPIAGRAINESGVSVKSKPKAGSK